MVRHRWVRLALVMLAALPFAVDDVQAQQNGADQVINLFYDPNAPGARDRDFFTREVTWVNWVRDREDADVHVIVTSETTGGGGRLYLLDFIGLRDFEGEDAQLTFSTAGDSTSDEQRNGIAERLKLGLVRYAATTSAADRLRVQFGDPGAGGGPPGGGVGGPGGAATQQDDPWDFWTFRINGNGNLNGQSTSRRSSYFGTFSANRTTEAWKIQLGARFNRSTQEFDLEDSSGTPYSVSETLEDWGLNGSLVRSIGEQWAVGVRADAGSSTFLNQDLRVSVMPGLEYNFLPYSESSRRSVTLQYLVGPNHFAYTERTIFNETYETRMRHTLTGRVSLVQPWGRWSTSLSTAQYLHDTEKYSVTLSGNFNIRLFRGFSIRMGGNYSWIRDQLQISAERLTQEQVLLFQRQLETSYRYFTSFGIEYRFGSIFNNVVNPRFGPGGGGEIFFF